MVSNLMRIVDTTDKQYRGYTFEFASTISIANITLDNLRIKQIDSVWYLVYNTNYVMLCKVED